MPGETRPSDWPENSRCCMGPAWLISG